MEKTLSNKAVKDLECSNPMPNYYWEKDIKEFVKNLKDACNKRHSFKNVDCEFCMEEGTIDKLAGKELVE